MTKENLLLADDEIREIKLSNWPILDKHGLERAVARAQHGIILRELKALDKQHTCCKDFDDAIQELIVRMEEK